LIAEERDSERVQGLRRKFEAWQETVDARRVFCIDETGSTIAMTRKYGRASAATLSTDVSLETAARC